MAGPFQTRVGRGPRQCGLPAGVESTQKRCQRTRQALGDQPSPLTGTGKERRHHPPHGPPHALTPTHRHAHPHRCWCQAVGNHRVCLLECHVKKCRSHPASLLAVGGQDNIRPPQGYRLATGSRQGRRTPTRPPWTKTGSSVSETSSSSGWTQGKGCPGATLQAGPDCNGAQAPSYSHSWPHHARGHQGVDRPPHTRSLPWPSPATGPTGPRTCHLHTRTPLHRGQHSKEDRSRPWP